MQSQTFNPLCTKPKAQHQFLKARDSHSYGCCVPEIDFANSWWTLYDYVRWYWQMLNGEWMARIWVVFVLPTSSCVFCLWNVVQWILTNMTYCREPLITNVMWRNIFSQVIFHHHSCFKSCWKTCLANHFSFHPIFTIFGLMWWAGHLSNWSSLGLELWRKQNLGSKWYYCRKGCIEKYNHFQCFCVLPGMQIASEHSKI